MWSPRAQFHIALCLKSKAHKHIIHRTAREWSESCLWAATPGEASPTAVSICPQTIWLDLNSQHTLSEKSPKSSSCSCFTSCAISSLSYWILSLHHISIQQLPLLYSIRYCAQCSLLLWFNSVDGLATQSLPSFPFSRRNKTTKTTMQ